jgi:gliding motility-associated-like protein
MKSLYRCCLLLFLLSSITASAQVSIKVGEHFLSGVAVQKLHVCVEDHSVWVLTKAGQVLYKLNNQSEFSEYPSTKNYTVSGITGFNANEMFFITGAKVLRVLNGVSKQLDVDFPGVTRINAVAVNYGKNIDYGNNAPLSLKDYLSVATNKDLYFLLRGSDQINIPYGYQNKPTRPEAEWEISYSGFKSVNYRYFGPSASSCLTVNRTTLERSHGYDIFANIPDMAPYPEKVNATVFSIHPGSPFTFYTSWMLRQSFWATDKGVFSRDWAGTCDPSYIKNYIPEEIVNDLEEVQALHTLYEQNFIFAGSNTGLFASKYSVHRMYPMAATDTIRFERIQDFPRQKVNALKVETTVQAFFNNLSQEKYFALCEKVLWVATDSGVYSVYITLDQEYYKNFVWGEYSFDKPSSNSDQVNPVFDLCNQESVHFTSRLPSEFKNQVMIQWFKDGKEQPQWLGKLNLDLSDPGEYYFKITALCELIAMNSGKITIHKTASPELTFNYPAQVSVCPGETFTMSTKQVPGYLYRWFKNGVLIPEETTSTFSATSSGSYHVEASNCGSNYTSSPAVELTVKSMPAAVVLADKADYCAGENAVLHVDNPLGLKVKWFLDSKELRSLEDQDVVHVNEAGLYKAVFYDGSCNSLATPYLFSPHPLPTVTIRASGSSSFCQGETVTLTAVADDAVSYLWSTGETGPSIRISVSGRYGVLVRSRYGCSGESAMQDVIIQTPPMLEQPADLGICVAKKEQIDLKAAAGFKSYTWNGVKGTSNIFFVSQPGKYLLEVEDEQGCKARIYYNVYAKCGELNIPNAFSPNGDGVNDTWNISGLEDDPSATIKVFNRYGLIVYSTRGNNATWDGTNGGTLPVGVYYYVISTIHSSKALQGSVTIIR